MCIGILVRGRKVYVGAATGLLRSTPECVSGRPSDRDDPGQDSATRERKTLLLKPRSVTEEQNKEAAAVPKDLSLHLRPRGSILEERDPLTRLG
ncbi:hypothetical protein HPB52_018289 [Rhipicephalus sanguineus]|uniref:Uncharacterized protein n=1 Tax=Rhipicephalus sanguineus TaxID=34632 RepID=A0A9D4PI60_RHISA|nr:hypothetical protein HPB52_018289 [Rhipicephalus sanguineus]